MAIETQQDSAGTITQAELDLINGRNRFIDNVLKEGDKALFRQSNWFLSLALRGIAKYSFAKTNLIGSENLDYAYTKLGEERITIVSSHDSDANHHCLERVLREHGYSRIARLLTFAAGLKMWDRLQTKWAMPSLNSFPLAAPGYFEDAQEISNRPLSSEQQELVEEYTIKMNKLNKATFKALVPPWDKGKAVVVVYAEGTRSRDGLLKRGKEETGGYMRHGLILPVMQSGVHEYFPAERKPNWKKILLRQTEVTIAVNEPIDAKKLKSPSVKAWLKERNASPVDFVMARIAALNPDQVDQQFRSLYESLNKDIPEGLLLKAA